MTNPAILTMWKECIPGIETKRSPRAREGMRPVSSCKKTLRSLTRLARDVSRLVGDSYLLFDDASVKEIDPAVGVLRISRVVRDHADRGSTLV